MITIKPSYGRYYSDFEGQQSELEAVLSKIPEKYILEVKPNKLPPQRVWWSVYTNEKLEELKTIIGGGKIVEDSDDQITQESITTESGSVVNTICKKIGHSPARCEVLGDNGVYTLIKLPPVQRPKEGYYKAPCVIKVNNASLEYTEVFDSTGTRLGKHVLARLIKEHL